jgi:hypothetical protein
LLGGSELLEMVAFGELLRVQIVLPNHPTLGCSYGNREMIGRLKRTCPHAVSKARDLARAVDHEFRHFLPGYTDRGVNIREAQG